MSVKFFHSNMTGAPVISGTAGSMVSVLDACLKDGFGAKAVTSLTISGGVATLNFTGGTAAVAGSTVLVSGATPSSLNGDKKVLSASATAVTFATTEVDGSATGSITFKMSPLGWLKPFTGANLAVYKPSVPEATGCFLRVDDTDAGLVRVVAYESMSDVNTGVAPFPNASQVSGGMGWPKSNAAGTAARPWAVFGDEQFFAIYVAPHASWPNHGVLLGFGDFISYKSGDGYGCALFGGGTNVTTTGSPVGGDLGYTHASGTPVGGYVARASTGLGGSQVVGKLTAYALNAGWSGNGGLNNSILSYPNPADNGLLVSPVDLHVSGGLRGRLPGVHHSPQNIGEAFSFLDRVEGTGPFSGKTFMALRTGTPGSSSFGVTFIDITGPWRV